MRRVLSLGFAATVLVLSTLVTDPAFARDRDFAIDRRQAEQLADIRRGIATGRLTPREADFLWREQAAIAEFERRAKWDRVLTPREARRIRAAQERAGRDIYREIRDRDYYR